MCPPSGDCATDTDIARLRVVITRVSRQLRKQQSSDGLTPTQYSALTAVRREGPVTLGRIAEVEGIAPPTVTRVIDKLCSLGLVERRAVPGDRRVTQVLLTRLGEELLDGARQRTTAWLESQVSTLSDSDRIQLFEAVRILETLVGVETAP